VRPRRICVGARGNCLEHDALPPSLYMLGPLHVSGLLHRYY